MRNVLIAVFVTIIFCLFAVTAVAANSEFLLGDIDCNDEIDPADARLILRHTVKLESFSDDIVQSADIDGNGVIDPADARIVLRVAVGLENIIDYYSDEIYSIYHDVFEMYKEGFKNYFYFGDYSSFAYSEDDPFDKMGKNPSQHAIFGGIEALYYTFVDLSKDGVPELFFSKTNNQTANAFMDAFGYEDGKVYRLFETNAIHERLRYYVYKNGIVYYEGSGGAFFHNNTFFALPKNCATPVKQYEFWLEETKDGRQYSLINDSTKQIISEQLYNEIVSKYSENRSLQWKLLCKTTNYQFEEVEKEGNGSIFHSVIVTDITDNIVTFYYYQSYRYKSCYSPIIQVKNDGNPVSFEWTDEGNVSICTISFLDDSIILSFKTNSNTYKTKEFSNMELLRVS